MTALLHPPPALLFSIACLAAAAAIGLYLWWDSEE